VIGKEPERCGRASRSNDASMERRLAVAPCMASDLSVGLPIGWRSGRAGSVERWLSEALNQVKIHKGLRRIVPSAARLTYNPVFQAVVDSFDLLPRFLYREFSNIPPNHLRIRVGAAPGVARGILANQAYYLTVARDFWIHAFHAKLCRLDSTIVDIGCGCGRFAHYLRDYKFKSEKFAGKYIGVDIDSEMLDWCRKHFDSERFQFFQSTHPSKVYLNSESGEDNYALPIADGVADLVFSTSLFTHLLEGQLIDYCRESNRVLKPGAYMAMYCFCLDYPPPTFGDRHTFSHEIGNAYVESIAFPEAAVAYREAFLLRIAREAGFRTAEIFAAQDDLQPLLLCQK
jgi:SAM-dependent methyltransferase